MKSFRSKPCLFIGLFSLLFFLPRFYALAQVAVVIGTNFIGSTYDNGTGNGGNSSAIPPDANGAVGPAHFVEFINGSLTTYPKTSTHKGSLAERDFLSSARPSL